MSGDVEDISVRLRARIAEIEGTGMRSRDHSPSIHDEGSTASISDQTEPSAISGLQDDGSDAEERAFRKVERLSLVRERASSELRRRLVREGFTEDVSARAVDRAVACGLVDDLRYAEVLIRTRLAAGRGRYGIESELSTLDIDVSDVPDWPDVFVGSDEDEINRAITLLERKPPRAKNLRDAAYRRLVGKGYSQAAAYSAARLWTESYQGR